MPDSANITSCNIIFVAIEETDSAVHTYLNIFLSVHMHPANPGIFKSAL